MSHLTSFKQCNEERMIYLRIKVHKGKVIYQQRKAWHIFFPYCAPNSKGSVVVLNSSSCYYYKRYKKREKGRDREREREREKGIVWGLEVYSLRRFKFQIS